MKLSIFRLSFVFTMSVGAVWATESDTSRPNILWIIAEDMGPELGCYGTPGVATPFLDELATRGMRFESAFTVTPVCSTSRSSFMTGMYAMSIGAHNHRSHRDGTNPLPDGVRLLTDWLRPHGYTTANLTKLTDDERQARFYKGTGKNDWNFSYPKDREPFDVSSWQDLKTHQPFYAQISFSETHRGAAWNKAHENIPHPADPRGVRIPPYYPDHPLTRAVWAQYLNAVMAVDKKVGFILDLLERDGLKQNTIVVFMTDHGRAMPRGKQWPYDSGLHIPLLIYWPEDNPSLPVPEGYERGSSSDQLIASIDLTATTLDWAGVPKPSRMQGHVLFGPNRDHPRDLLFGGRDRGDETVFHVRTVRDKRFRYLRNKYPEKPFLARNTYKETSYPIIGLLRDLHSLGQLSGPPAALMADSRPVEELYDLASDPWEINNLAASPKFEATKERLSQALDEWMDAIDDQGRIPEPDSAIAPWRTEQEERYRQRTADRQPNWYALHPSLGPYGKLEVHDLAKDNFESGLEQWELFDPRTWRLSQREGNHTFAITARESEYRPPVRSPTHMALLRDVQVSSFDMTFRVRSTNDTGPHRDCCVFFGFQDPKHFYYVHLGAQPDPHSGQIMVVDGAARRALTKNQRPTPWDDSWHTVKIERRLLDGTINVYFDDLATPHMTVRDHRFGRGRVGIGSFDDMNEFDDLVLTGG